MSDPCPGDQLPDDAQESPRTAWLNLRQGGRLTWKLRRFLMNNGIKVARRQRCCGHDGEPGC